MKKTALIAAVAIAALCSWSNHTPDWRVLDSQEASAIMGGACKNPLGSKVCGDGRNRPDNSVCIKKKGMRPGNSEGIVHSNKTLCYNPDNPPRTEWDVANCTHTHKKCLNDEDF